MKLRPSVCLAVLVAATLLANATTAEAQRRRRRRRAQGPGTLVLRTDVEGAEVIVDEETVGFTPVDPLQLSPGQHTIRVRRPGFTEFDDVITVSPGEETAIDVPLIALAMIVTVRSTPDEARVFIDDSFRGTAPIEVELSEGDHEIRVTLPLYQEVTRQVSARAGETELIDVTLEPIPEELLNPPDPEWYEEPLTWILVGAGALVLAAGIIAIAVVATEQSALDSFCGEDACFELRITSAAWRF